MKTSACIIALFTSLLVSIVMGLWFYPDKRKMRVTFAISLLISLPIMLYAMTLPL